MYRIYQRRSKGSSFVLVKAFLDKLYCPLWSLGSTLRRVQQVIIESEEMAAVYRKQSFGTDNLGGEDFCIENGEIEAENIWFSYDSRKTILKDLSFYVLPGRMVALVGVSGCGKSTIIHLISRFFDVTSGRIKIDGREITGIKLQSLKNQVGVVLQVNPFPISLIF